MHELNTHVPGWWSYIQ
ncbi:hypothetical protein [Paenibacillus sp.]